MCPYCQKQFKTAVNCKKHMKTHRHEVALQALNQQTDVTTAEAEVTVSHDVAGGTEVTEVNAQEVELIEVTQSTDLHLTQALEHNQLSQEEQQMAAVFEQTDLSQEVIHDTFDADIHNAFNQQVTWRFILLVSLTLVWGWFLVIFCKWREKEQTLLLPSDRKPCICHRMTSFRIMYILTLTYMFRVMKFKM